MNKCSCFWYICIGSMMHLIKIMKINERMNQWNNLSCFEQNLLNWSVNVSCLLFWIREMTQNLQIINNSSNTRSVSCWWEISFLFCFQNLENDFISCQANRLCHWTFVTQIEIHSHQWLWLCSISMIFWWLTDVPNIRRALCKDSFCCFCAVQFEIKKTILNRLKLP